MIQGVWGSKNHHRSPADVGSSGSSTTSEMVTEFLVSRINAVGLDGAICAEYVVSLVDLYRTEAAERDAAIEEFLSDSIAASNIASEAQRARFVNEVLAGVKERLHGQTIVEEPQVAAEKFSSSTTNFGKQKGFKKGIKISGTALKQVVGNVKPSFVQRYSDDENPPIPARSSMLEAQAPVARFVAEPLPPLSLKNTPSAAATKRRVKAREIGPDETWEQEELEKPGRKTTTPWKSPLSEHMMTPMETPPEKQASLSVSTVSVADIPAAEPPNPYSFHQDMLSFDFKFEGEDDSETQSPQPIDLFKQMFASGVSTSLPPSLELSPPRGLEILQEPAESRRVYSSACLLEIFRLMRSESPSGQLDLPLELRSLTRSCYGESQHLSSPTKTAVSLQPPKFHSDTNWRTVKSKPEQNATDNTHPAAAGGAWRASGYGQRWNGSKPHHQKIPTPPADEGFW